MNVAHLLDSRLFLFFLSIRFNNDNQMKRKEAEGIPKKKK
jgi:hypothetical protein